MCDLGRFDPSSLFEGSSSEITPQVQKHFPPENSTGVPEGRAGAQGERDVDEFVSEP